MPVQDRYPDFVADQRQFFDELITEDWDTYQSADWDYSRTFEVQRLLKKIQPRRILDIGCGCGFRDQVMAEYPFVESIDAIDYSARSIEAAERAYPHPKVTRTVASFETVQLPHKYDLVVSFQVIEHLVDTDAYLRFCVENCVADGYVTISTGNRLRLSNRLLWLRGREMQMEDPMHHREYTPRELTAMAKQFGLKPHHSFAYALPELRWLPMGMKMLAGYWLPPLACRIVCTFKNPQSSAGGSSETETDGR